MTRPEKHSVTLKGHRTSISLEPDFWRLIRSVALRDGLSLNALISQIDEARITDVGLASAIRLYILHDLERQIKAAD